MELVLTSILAFASTNVDDIFILALFFSDKRYRSRDIHLGQYLGIALLIGVSLAGAVLGHFIDARYVGLLGLVPIYLALKQVVQLVRNRNEVPSIEQHPKRSGLFSVAAVTFANGGDNIGTYIPLLASLSSADKAIMIAIFLAMVMVWLTLARYLTHHPVLAKAISRYGHIVTPVVLFLLGLFILRENGSFGLLNAGN